MILPETRQDCAGWKDPSDDRACRERVQVRADIRWACRKFFRFNPDGIGYGHEPARDAVLCGR